MIFKNNDDKRAENNNIVNTKIGIPDINNIQNINKKFLKKKKKKDSITKVIDMNEQIIEKFEKNNKRNRYKSIIFPVYPPRKSGKNKIKTKKNREVTDINSINGIKSDKNKDKSSTISKDYETEIEDKLNMDYNDNELNSLIYKQALKHDKRSYIQYYLSLLKVKNLLIFSIYKNKKDYNSQIIKIFLFFFFFAIHLIVNALFFNDKTMHKIYMDEGEYNFVYQIPQMIYSTIISSIIILIIKFLALSESNILKIKRAKTIEDLELKREKNIRILKVKLFLFYVITFILLFLFMFYITCFCGIYENTQIHLINDTLICFGLSLIYPFGIYLIPGIFRISALRAKNRDKECLFKFSKVIQSI